MRGKGDDEALKDRAMKLISLWDRHAFVAHCHPNKKRRKEIEKCAENRNQLLIPLFSTCEIRN